MEYSTPALHAGKAAIVTGGASGIGRATVLQLAAEGARVCVADIDGDAAERTAKEVEASGGEAIAISVDVSQPDANELAVAKTVEAFGGLDIAFLNAGIARGSTIRDGDLEAFDEVIRVNLRGVFLGMRAVVEPMIERGQGAILCTASVAGLRGGSNMPSYYASKHGVVGLVKAAAIEFAAHDVRVNAICPGVIDTPILGPAHGVAAITDLLGKIHLLGRVGQAKEVAALVSFLASDRAGFMTGSAYPIDGGLTAGFGGAAPEPGQDQERQALFDRLSSQSPKAD